MNPESMKAYLKVLRENSNSELFMELVNLGRSMESFDRMRGNPDTAYLGESGFNSTMQKINMAKNEFLKRLKD